MKNLFSLLLFTFSGLFLSCQKKDNSSFDKSKLEILISQPAEAQLFKKGDTVFIKATAVYSAQLHGYSLTLWDKNTQEVFLDINKHVHDAAFTLNSYWVDTLNRNADLILKLTVEADHKRNEDYKEVNFRSYL